MPQMQLFGHNAKISVALFRTGKTRFRQSYTHQCTPVHMEQRRLKSSVSLQRQLIKWKSFVLMLLDSK